MLVCSRNWNKEEIEVVEERSESLSQIHEIEVSSLSRAAAMHTYCQDRTFHLNRLVFSRHVHKEHLIPRLAFQCRLYLLQPYSAAEQVREPSRLLLMLTIRYIVNVFIVLISREQTAKQRGRNLREVLEVAVVLRHTKQIFLFPYIQIHMQEQITEPGWCDVSVQRKTYEGSKQGSTSPAVHTFMGVDSRR